MSSCLPRKVIACFLLARTGLATYAAVVKRDGVRVALPGGKVEPGESIMSCIRREVYEEGWVLPRKDKIFPICLGEWHSEGSPNDHGIILWFGANSFTRLVMRPDPDPDEVTPVHLPINEILKAPYQEPLMEWWKETHDLYYAEV